MNLNEKKFFFVFFLFLILKNKRKTKRKNKKQKENKKKNNSLWRHERGRTTLKGVLLLNVHVTGKRLG